MTTRSVPVVSELTAPYWEGAQNGHLTIQKCDDCSAMVFPPYPECLACSSGNLTWTKMKGTGVIHSVSRVASDILPGLEDLIPLYVALVELDESKSAIIPTNVVGTEIVAGMPVRVKFESLGNVELPIFERIVEGEASR